MPAVGEPFNRTISLSKYSYKTLTANSGQKWKVTMAYAKRGGGPKNRRLNVAPATGNENGEAEGTVTGTDDIPPIGSHTSDGSGTTKQLQPVYIDDTTGLYIGNDMGGPINVVVQGVRVA